MFTAFFIHGNLSLVIPYWIQLSVANSSVYYAKYIFWTKSHDILDFFRTLGTIFNHKRSNLRV